MRVAFVFTHSIHNATLMSRSMTLQLALRRHQYTLVILLNLLVMLCKPLLQLLKFVFWDHFLLLILSV